MRDSSTEAFKERSSINWPTLLVTGAIALAVSVGGGMLIYYLQQRGPKLVYSVSSGLPFDGSDKTVSTYQVVLTNDGNQVADDITCAIYLAGSTIEQKRIDADASQTIKLEGTNDFTRLHIGSLNPSETVDVKILASATPGSRIEPKVSVRGRGVTGKPKPLEKGSDKEPLFALVTSSLVALSTAGALLSRVRVLLRRLGGYSVDPSRHSDDQRRIFAYVLRLNGFIHEADELQSRVAEAKFWAEADKLTRHVIDSSDVAAMVRAASALDNLLSYAEIHEESAALIKLDLAKLRWRLGDHQAVRSLLRSATKDGGPLVASRLQLDPELKNLL